MENDRYSLNEQMRAVLNSMVEGVMILDQAGKIVLINRALRNLFNLGDEAINLKPIEAIRNSDLNNFLKDVLENKRTIETEIEMLSPVEKIFKIRALIYNDAESAICGTAVIFYDITELRKLETMRSEFVANVSHELKTPLTNIKASVETLEGIEKNNKGRDKFIGIIKKNSERLENLINDLLDLSSMESKKAELEKTKFNIIEVIEDAVLSMKVLIKKKKITVKTSIPGKLSVIYADRARIEQVIINLISNAVKFNNDGGKVLIYAEDAGSMIKFTVEDNGIGIPSKDLPRIFERFYRVDKARSRELGGTGLGLSIVKHMIKLHGGEAAVEAAPEKGSKFSFTIPKL